MSSQSYFSTVVLKQLLNVTKQLRIDVNKYNENESFITVVYRAPGALISIPWCLTNRLSEEYVDTLERYIEKLTRSLGQTEQELTNVYNAFITLYFRPPSEGGDGYKIAKSTFKKTIES